MTAYGFFAALGGLSAILWLRRHRVGLGVTDNEFWAAMWTLLLGGIVGAKGFFVILGWPHYARGELRFWADFGTGFVFFGGLVGAAMAGVVFAWVRRLDFLRGADYFAVALPLGHAFGRVGCFFQGCCGGHPPHPVQLYEAAGLVVIAGVGRWVLSRVEAGRLGSGAAFAAYLALYGLLRLFLDPLRADGRPERWLGLSAQQGFALVGFVLGLTFLLWRADGFDSRARRRFADFGRSHHG
ncbi:MAG: prolipoprotein diacylglyceryl transferase [Verrucomicrobia bacterium]|nr:prolipoprotein diacylglyceryl transferase [Verrucomicrobiota bacterium]